MTIPVFIGYDPREDDAYRVLVASILARASQPAKITPLILANLPMLTRPRHPLQSTEFSFSRFLVPFLCNYEGWALFMDCDMLCLDDIAKLWALRDDWHAVSVVKHDHVPHETTKFLGEKQTAYDMKNWSSLMLFNNRKCKSLTPEYVNTASGLDLHQFRWLPNDHWLDWEPKDDVIGELPSRWNHLVGYDAPRDDAALAHFSNGGPWFSGYENCEYSEEWFAERDRVCGLKKLA